MEQQRILITGGAGFLGINLCRALSARGYTLTSLDIAEFEDPALREVVTAVRGDIRDPLAVDRAMAGVDLVVHTAAALPLYTPHDIFTTDVEGTRVVLDSALRHGVKRAVHISSTAVYGIPDHHPLLETDRLEGVGPYGQAKIQAEMVALEHRARGLVVPILRPKSFIGPERLGVFALLYDWAIDGKNFPAPGSGNNLYQYLDVSDLCDAIILCLTLPAEQVDDTFNIGAAEFGTVKQDFQAVLDAAGHGKKVIPIPATPAIVALRVLDRFRLSPLYKWVYETITQDSFVSIEKAQRQLGFAPKYSNRQALLRNFEWYCAHRHTFATSSGITHRAPWKQGALGVVKRFF
jgi:nucleoside-diphosphate-sugar epimerase